MEYLLGKAKVEGVTPIEESELRGYIAQEDPSVKNFPLKELITFGAILVGAYLFLKLLEEQ